MNSYFQPRIISVLTDFPTAEGYTIQAHIPYRIPSEYEEFLVKEIQRRKNECSFGNCIEFRELQNKLDEFRKTHPFNPNLSLEELRELNL